ncbi:MAG: AAA family ATPase, partial [Dehalococcoidia bacterium]|nr:AAA family ATPase [Dehalococcoidia bacterium]
MAGSQREPRAAVPLLQTKLYPPRWREGLVPRPELVARLERGASGRLTLVSAPAGSGKTTLLGEWLAEHPSSSKTPAGREIAWLSLDAADSDLDRFWTYVVAALQAVRPELGEAARAMLESGHAPAIDVVLAMLLNDIAASPDDLVLVLDDYHVIESAEVHDAMAFLVDRLPPQMHIVILSRADPALPLARLRARGELVELRAAELRFSAAEAATFLGEVMGLDLAPADVEALEGRTEGWIAGLQLAALSMQGRDDVAGFVEAFAGNDRYIVDYLVEEVLQRQPPRVREFLLRTSILERLSGALCDAVTGQSDGATMLEELDRANLFVVPLDGRRQWYRYHHLFGDVLRAHLGTEPGEDASALHGRASEWYAAAGHVPEAIEHALRGGHLEL